MGRKNYLIDTNAVIYYFGQKLSKESEKYMDQILIGKYHISVINRIELLGFNTINTNESDAINSFIKNSTVFQLDESVIIETIHIRKKYIIKLPDAIIAATCLVKDCSLITNNTKDFERIAGLQLIKL